MAARTSTKQIRSTRNYRLFHRDKQNRVLDLKKHRKLQKSMERYGFLQSFPIVCHRNGSKTLSVKDGQHRLAFAEQLGLPVYFVEEDVDFDVADVNNTQKIWATKDYALKFAADGVSDYQEGLEFSEQYGIPVGKAFSLLAGTTSFNNVQDAFCGGVFKIKDRDWAHAVAGVYSQMCRLSSDLKKAAFLDACMSICRVPEFDAERLVQCAARCRDKLVSYSTRDAYLAMLEEVYNFGRKHLFGLKSAAVMAMRDRSPCGEKQVK